jgi:uncharacterized protein involved in outer membrane biogenesis
MRGKQADIKLRAKHVLTPKISLKDLSVDLKLKDGKLEIEPLTAKLGGGDFKAAVSLADLGKQAMLALDLSLRNCRLETILEELGEKEKTLEGDLEVEVSLKGRGGSVAGIMAGA